FQAHPEWFGEEVAGHLTKGAAIKAVRYLQAQKERQSIVRAIDILFTFSDLLILPTTPIVSTPAQEPGTQLPFLALTVPFSLGGYPAVSVPMGEVDGLPVGLQIVARRGDDYLALAAAIAFEAAFQAARP
ncbi:MAG TPA: amidase family protein, partial [Polyangiaceae bacterium]|nr:amidase family protein [Polyangiaceae bacterium]